MNENEKPASPTKLFFQKVGRTATDSAKLAVKVAFITAVALSTVGLLKKAAAE
jgi:hypothetical protein